MNKKFRSRIAALCLLTFSNTVLASGGGGITGGPTIGIGTGTGTSTGTGTGIGLCDRRNPATLRFCTGIGTRPGSGTPVTIKPKLGSKIPGKFGTPQAEMKNGNVKKAKLACIQDAANSGAIMPSFSGADAWEYVSTNGPSDVSSKLGKLNSNSISTALNSMGLPKAIRTGPCESSQKKACVELLNKSMNEAPQAYYQSEVNENSDVWSEVGSYLGIATSSTSGEAKDISESLAEIASEDDKPLDPKSREALFGTLGEDDLLIATKLIIQAIDQALASGNVDRAERGKALLRRVNPSAAHAVDCVLATLPNRGLNVDANPSSTGVLRGDVQKVGPLSGTDYNELEDLKTHGSQIQNVMAIVAGTLALVAIIQSAVYRAQDKEMKKQEQADQLNKDTLDQAEKYLSCTFGKWCDKIYPLGSEYVKAEKAKEQPQRPAGTAGPATPVEKDPFQSILPDKTPAPCTGCGGAGGEKAPPEPRSTTPGWADLLGRPDKQDSWKHTDDAAAERLCSDVVIGFKKFASDKIRNGGRPAEKDSSASGRKPSIVGPRFSVTSFEQWTASFWEQQKKELQSRHGADEGQNNCNAMDAVEEAI